jgi:hypothetical protein
MFYVGFSETPTNSCFEIGRKAIFLKINLVKTVGPHDNILKLEVFINIVAKSKECIEFITIREQFTLIGGKIFHFELNRTALQLYFIMAY